MQGGSAPLQPPPGALPPKPSPGGQPPGTPRPRPTIWVPPLQRLDPPLPTSNPMYEQPINPQGNMDLVLSQLMAHNWQKWKRVFLTCLCHKIYRDEAVGLKICKYSWKNLIFVKMWNLGQYHENLIFCQLFNWSSNLKILLHMCDTYNCDYLKHSTFRFNLIDFQLNTDFP